MRKNGYFCAAQEAFTVQRAVAVCVRICLTEKTRGHVFFAEEVVYVGRFE